MAVKKSPIKRKQKYPVDLDPVENKIYLKKKLEPKNEAQRYYMECLEEGKIIICNGAAGTGKTFIACYVALKGLLEGKYSKIVLTRPIVEAGEHLGFLPGGVDAKLNPYLLPLLFSFEAMIGPTKLKELMENKKIEAFPLAYMRGITLGSGFGGQGGVFAILDEAQNATKEQLRMFVTRIGYGSTMCINGDETQSDISFGKETSIEWLSNKLVGVDEDILIVKFHKSDIVRSPLINKILTAFENE